MHETTCEKRKKESQRRNEISSRHAVLEHTSRLLALETGRASVGPSRQAGPSQNTAGLHIAPSILTYAPTPSISTHVPTLDDDPDQHHDGDAHSPARESIDEGHAPLDALGGDAARLRAESDASMRSVVYTATGASTTSTSSNMEFKTTYHSRSQRAEKIEPWDKFRNTTHPLPASNYETSEPWQPFKSRADCEFASIAIDGEFSKDTVDRLLGLMRRVESGTAKVSFKNNDELRSVCDKAAEELTPVSIVIQPVA